ncbi:MAG: M28 family peptidase, partial [Candidatus Kariarchaeaceae archaeon]
IGLYMIFPLLSIALLAIAIFFFYTENDNWPTVSRIMPKQSSQNVIGKIKAQKRRLGTVLLIAHMDTSRADSAHNPSRVAGFRKLVLGNLILYCTIFILFSLGQIIDVLIFNLTLMEIVWYISLLLAIPVVYSYVLAVTRQSLSEMVVGANDNTSGVAVVLELMNLVSKNPLQNTEVISVLTGCEESGCGGILEFLKEYGSQYREDFYLNFDNIGAGNPIFASKEGIFFRHHANKNLLQLARLVQKENPNIKIKEQPFRAGYTDGTAAMVRGYKVLSFLALNEDGVPPHWHWKTDTVENLEEEVIISVKDFGVKLIKKIDEDFVKGKS